MAISNINASVVEVKNGQSYLLHDSIVIIDRGVATKDLKFYTKYSMVVGTETQISEAINTLKLVVATGASKSFKK